MIGESGGESPAAEDVVHLEDEIKGAVRVWRFHEGEAATASLRAWASGFGALCFRHGFARSASSRTEFVGEGFGEVLLQCEQRGEEIAEGADSVQCLLG